MTREEVVVKLADYFKKAFRVDADITADTKITETFGTNSIKRIAVCSMIEDDLEVTIPAKKFADFETIGDLADKILEELA